MSFVSFEDIAAAIKSGAATLDNLRKQLAEEQEKNERLEYANEALQREVTSLRNTIDGMARETIMIVKQNEALLQHVAAMQAFQTPIYVVQGPVDPAQPWKPVKLQPRTPTAITWLYEGGQRYNLHINYDDGTSEKLHANGTYMKAPEYRYEVTK